MSIVQGQPHYACYARWVVGATTYAVGTDETYRDGVWHNPNLKLDTALTARFMQGATMEPRGFDLQITDHVLGTFQTLVAGDVLDGIDVTVTCVCTITLSDGTTSVQTRAQVLTIRGTRIEPGRVVISLIDLEDAKLGTLYPAELWTADVFRDIAQADTGVAIPHAVGTARKLKAALLSADTVNAYWHYGVCNAPLLTLPITAINTGTKTFTVAGDYTDRISATTVLFSSTSSANPGRYTVTAASYSSPNTLITVAEAVGSATVSGNLLVPPTVLAVYRDGRLVSPSEYTVEMTWPALTQFADADFDNSPADWSGIATGTGTATLTGGVGRLTGNGTLANYGRLNAATLPVECQRGAHHVVTLTLATAGRVRMSTLGVGNAGTAVVSGQGTHTALVQAVPTTGVRRVDLSGYNTGYSGTVDVDNIHINTTHRLLTLRFLREQIGFDGSAHTIEVDVRGVESRNAVDEIARLLTIAGCTPDAGSFASAQAYATTHRMLVDCDHGALVNGDSGSTGQRRISAILGDLCYIARASLVRTSAGAYALVQDKPGTSAATYSEPDGDLITINVVQRPPRPRSVSMSFAPNAVDPSRTRHTIARDVTGGVLDEDKPRDVRFITDTTAADRLLCYLALRAQYARIVRGRVMLASHSLGDVITVHSPSVGLHTPTPVWLTRAQQVPGGIDFEAVEYDANVHVYTAGTLPADASDTYQPDYSQTPPAAPTALTITTASTALANDGGSIGRLSATLVPPAANWVELWIWCIHNTTGEITGLARAELITGTTYGCTLTGLRPGEVYQLKADAVSTAGIHSPVPNTFNASAIGGSPTATTFTAPGYATPPATVGSCTATQGMGRLIRIAWSNVATANTARYVLERSVGGGGFAEIARPDSNNYTDTDVSIGVSHQYRVKAVDRYGNVSAAWATSGSVTPSGNISGGSSGNDINSSTVDTANRTAATAIAATCVAGDVLTMRVSEGVLFKTVAHALGKVPMVGGGVYSGAANVIVTAANPTTTTIDIVFTGMAQNFTKASSTNFSASYVEAQLDAHQHEVDYNVVTAGDTGTISIW